MLLEHIFYFPRFFLFLCFFPHSKGAARAVILFIILDSSFQHVSIICFFIYSIYRRFTCLDGEHPPPDMYTHPFGMQPLLAFEPPSCGRFAHGTWRMAPHLNAHRCCYVDKEDKGVETQFCHQFQNPWFPKFWLVLCKPLLRGS